jgi:hypothetical protein
MVVSGEVPWIQITENSRAPVSSHGDIQSFTLAACSTTKTAKTKFVGISTTKKKYVSG